jgi:hypothetical protein
MKKRKTRRERHEELIRTDPGFRRLVERIEQGRTPAERAAYPLWSRAWEEKSRRELAERIAELQRREAS